MDILKIDNEEEDEVDDENLDVDPITGKDTDTNTTTTTAKEESPALEADEDEEGETRCICGELDPPDELGLYIQCEKCGIWQHGFCIGILNEKETPDKYWCEVCKPNLHNIYLNDLGERKSLYKPIQDKKRQRKRTSRLQNNNKNNHQTTATTDISTRTPTPTQNSNSSSSASLKEDEEQLNKDEPIDNPKLNDKVTDNTNNLKHEDENDSTVNELDSQNNNIQNTTSNNNDNNNNNNNTIPLSNSNSTITPPNKESTDNSTTSYDENDKRFQDRKRATFLAREEKQYQRMLEKAILESKRSTNNGDEVGVDMQTDNVTTTNKPTITNDTPNTEENDGITRKDGTTEIIPPSANDASLDTQEGKLIEVDNNIDPPSRVSSPGLKRNASPKSLKNQRRSKRNKRSKTSTTAYSNSINASSSIDKPTKYSKRNASNSNKDKNESSNSNEIDINKPVKPRLPPSRTTINEMSRRVSAILEFISRTQWELSQDQQSKEDLIKFVENDEFLVKIDDIYDSFNGSLKLMDNLTRNLLVWEKKYSNSNNNS